MSEKQSQVLKFIEEEIAKTGRPPSFRDIARHLGCTAVGTVQDHVQALIKKGFLKKDPHRARSLMLAHRSESLDIPILGAVPAGRPIEAIEDRAGSLPVPSRWQGDLFALKVHGDSMIEAGILEGDYVIVRKQSHANHGDIVVATIRGEATVKTLEKKAGRFRLLPANSRYAPIEIPEDGESRIEGKVVSVQRYFG